MLDWDLQSMVIRFPAKKDARAIGLVDIEYKKIWYSSIECEQTGLLSSAEAQ